MKKIIIIILVIINAFVIWSIVDQPCQPPPRDGIELEKDCYPEPRWIKWTTVINNWYDDNRGTKDMRYAEPVFIGIPYDDEDTPLQLETVLISCKLQKEEGAIFTIQLSFENGTHTIDNTTCKWNLLDDGAMQP